jgi:hypothetical protein
MRSARPPYERILFTLTSSGHWVDHLARDRTMPLTNDQVKDAVSAISSAYTYDDLDMLLYVCFSWRLRTFVSNEKNLQLVAFQLLTVAEEQGWGERLVFASYRNRAGNQLLSDLAIRIGMAAVSADLARLMAEALPALDLNSLRSRAAETEARTCRIEYRGQQHGTGSLVGPGELITAGPAFGRVVSGEVKPSEVTLRFDYRRLEAGATLAPGRIYKLAASDWLIDQGVVAPNGTNDTANDLDYVLVRVAEDPGLQPPELTMPGLPIRGWVRLGSATTPPSAGAPLFLAQHSEDGRFLLAFEPEGVIGVHEKSSRMLHRVPARPGSVGAPCFDVDWNLVAFHRDDDHDGRGARAILAQAVGARLREHRVEADGNGRLRKSSSPVARSVGAKSAASALKSFRPTVTPDPPISPERFAYRAAAAVLASFDPSRLKPAPPQSEDAHAAIELLADCSRVSGPEVAPRWALRPDLRRETLQRLDPARMRAALERNREATENPIQQMLSAYILGLAPPPTGRDVTRLQELLQVVEWLDGIAQGLPDSVLLRRRIDLELMLKPIRDRAGTHFRGRTEELGLLGRFLSESTERPLVIQGAGGVGKSALLGRFLLDHYLANGSWSPFIYIDFERPGAVEQIPDGLASEALRQLRVQSPDGRISGTPKNGPFERGSVLEESPGASDHTARGALVASVRKVVLPGEALVLVLDAFEEVVFRGASLVQALSDFFHMLRSELPRLYILIACRTPVAPLDADTLSLSALDPTQARSYLRDLGLSAIAAREIANKLGGNPRTLRLAATLVGRIGTRIFQKLKPDLSVSTHLWETVLSRIQDDSVRKIARFGCALRRLTPEIIMEILAEPCGLDVPTLDRASELFSILRSEAIWLRPGDDGALYMYRDVRRGALDLIQSTSPEIFRTLHERAVAYYSRADDARSRAEEIYHRLSLGQDPRDVDARWVVGIEPYLGAVPEELPPPAREYLSGRLSRGASLDTSLPPVSHVDASEPEHTQETGAEIIRH